MTNVIIFINDRLIWGERPFRNRTRHAIILMCTYFSNSLRFRRHVGLQGRDLYNSAEILGFVCVNNC